MNTLVIIIIALTGIAIYYWVDKFSPSNEVSNKSLDLKTTTQNQESLESKDILKKRITSTKEYITLYINKFYTRFIKVVINLTETEIKVISSITGTFVSLFFGYVFTNNIYYSRRNGNTERVFHETSFVDKSFNYALGYSILIIGTGIIYLLLNRIKKQNNKLP